MNKKHIPNLLTILRGVFTLIIIALFFSSFPEKYFYSLIFFILACITDFLDGYLSRLWKVVSDFGKIFDPLFDKLLTITLYFLLFPLLGNYFGLIFIILLLRDLIVDGLKNYLLFQGEVVAAIKSAKIKTSLQMLMIIFTLLYLIYSSHISLVLAFYLGLLAIIFSYHSGIIYLSKFIKFYGKNKKRS